MNLLSVHASSYNCLPESYNPPSLAPAVRLASHPLACRTKVSDLLRPALHRRSTHPLHGQRTRSCERGGPVGIRLETCFAGEKSHTAHLESLVCPVSLPARQARTTGGDLLGRSSIDLHVCDIGTTSKRGTYSPSHWANAPFVAAASSATGSLVSSSSVSYPSWARRYSSASVRALGARVAALSLVERRKRRSCSAM